MGLPEISRVMLQLCILFQPLAVSTFLIATGSSCLWQLVWCSPIPPEPTSTLLLWQWSTSLLQTQESILLTVAPASCHWTTLQSTTYVHIDQIVVPLRDETAISYVYRQVSNIRRTKFQHLKNSRTVLRLSLPNPFKHDVKSRMKM